MSLLTELEILGAGFLQRWRAYGAADAMDEGGGHELPITDLKSVVSVMNQVRQPLFLKRKPILNHRFLKF